MRFGPLIREIQMGTIKISHLFSKTKHTLEDPKEDSDEQPKKKPKKKNKNKKVTKFETTTSYLIAC